MTYSRREFGAAALAGAGLIKTAAAARHKPDSMIEGVQIGAITYSYRSMPDQSAEAILRYDLELSGEN